MQPTATEFIHSRGTYTGKPGLHRMQRLLETLGNPEKQLSFVHIVGTNGKGSTATLLADVLQRAGYRVGLFISPHLVRIHERIQVGGECIADTNLERITQTVAEAIRQTEQTKLPAGENIGEFECLTAMAFCYFAQRKCDIVVLEAGLGGAFDATNSIPVPLVSVFTPISLDHTQVLGTTVQAIAQTKAGILKPQTVAVCASGQPVEALQVLKDACKQMGIPMMQSPQAKVQHSDLQGTDFTVQGKAYHLRMLGEHQVVNACTVWQVVQVLRGKGFAIAESCLVDSFAHTQFAGRLEMVSEHPVILLDGAHNASGMEALCQYIQKNMPKGRVIAVLGMMQDKQVEDCVQILSRFAGQVYTCTPRSERGMDAKMLCQMVQEAGMPAQACQTAQEAIKQAKASATSSDIILICGSLYLVGECKERLA